jgi:hypothetical protein
VSLLLTRYNFTCILFSHVIKTTCNLDSNLFYRVYRNTGSFLKAASAIIITNGSQQFHTFGVFCDCLAVGKSNSKIYALPFHQCSKLFFTLILFSEGQAGCHWNIRIWVNIGKQGSFTLSVRVCVCVCVCTCIHPTNTYTRITLPVQIFPRFPAKVLK